MTCHNDESGVHQRYTMPRVTRTAVAAGERVALQRDRRAARIGWILMGALIGAAVLGLVTLARAGGCGESPAQSPQVEHGARRCG